jgi:hypothetical protein
MLAFMLVCTYEHGFCACAVIAYFSCHQYKTWLLIVKE